MSFDKLVKHGTGTVEIMQPFLLYTGFEIDLKILKTITNFLAYVQLHFHLTYTGLPVNFPMECTGLQ